MKEFFQKERNKKIAYIFLLLIILSFGAFARLWQLNEVPPGLHYDEAKNGLEAIEAAETGDYKFFYSGNNGGEGLYINMISFFLEGLGVNNFSARIASALLGIFTLLGFYFLLTQLRLSKATILIGVFLMASSFWHINFSHTVYHGILAPFILVWMLYVFILGIKRNNCWLLALSGLLLGAGFHSSSLLWFAPFIIIIIVVFFLFLKKDFLKKYWRGALVFLFSFVLAALPVFYYFYQNQDQLASRNDSVSIFNAPNMSASQAFGKSLGAHLKAFYTLGDPNQRHNHASAPLIPPAWAALFTLGFIFSLKEIYQSIQNKLKEKKPNRLFLPALTAQSVFWVMILPGLLNIEGLPHSLKIIGVIPAVMIFTALPFEYILRLRRDIQTSETFTLKPRRFKALNVSLAGLALIVLLSGMMEFYTYYFVWAKEPRTFSSFERELYDLGKLIKEIEPAKNNYIIIPQSDYKNFDIRVSPAKKTSSLKTAEFAGHPEIKKFQYFRPVEALKKENLCNQAVLVFLDTGPALLGRFQEKCPESTAQKIAPKNGYFNFWVLR
ncbi:MAG: glycosyltransferase family 39 protein [Candidatus Moranbacteria bacterium]|nr:glycosyltransferase family 39 protein [Candidatus Moranbacteria bacterium]